MSDSVKNRYSLDVTIVDRPLSMLR